MAITDTGNRHFFASSFWDETLWLDDCPKLKSLLDGIQSLTCLKELRIWDCPILSKRSQREIGEDWSQIAHIQDLYSCPDPNEDDNDKETSFAKRKSCNICKNFGLCITGTGSETSEE